MRRSNFVYPHPSPVARLSLAVRVMDVLDEIAAVEDHVEEVTC